MLPAAGECRISVASPPLGCGLQTVVTVVISTLCQLSVCLYREYKSPESRKFQMSIMHVFSVFSLYRPPSLHPFIPSSLYPVVATASPQRLCDAHAACARLLVARGRDHRRRKHHCGARVAAAERRRYCARTAALHTLSRRVRDAYMYHGYHNIAIH